MSLFKRCYQWYIDEDPTFDAREIRHGDIRDAVLAKEVA